MEPKQDPTAAETATTTIKWDKRDKLIEDEKKIQEELQIAVINYDYKNKNKYFVNFPMPYMNGTLHLGHAYTITKADFAARYYQLKGYNVLFPFGFHGTGTPIVSCAKKLREDLTKYNVTEVQIDSIPKDSQLSILLKMGIGRDIIHKFVDPYYWLEYFPKEAMKDLKLFGTSIDFSRSFITTDKNPYYDSFVKWQFKILSDKNKLKFGKKPVIFSIVDNQPCADHDRSIGEGVGIFKHSLLKVRIEDEIPINLLVTIEKDKSGEKQNEDEKIGNQLYINWDLKIGKYKFKDEYCISSQYCYNNLRYQYHDIDISDFCELSEDAIKGLFIKGFNLIIVKTYHLKYGSGIYSKTKSNFVEKPKNSILYLEPENDVISRSGDKCIVAIIDQWFIDYSEKIWKDPINDYILNNLETYYDQIKNQFINSSNWIAEWPCSRSFGMGTKLLDTEYIIDSLSDSTIYMAFYTVAHKITLISEKELSNDIWNFLFLNSGLPLGITEQSQNILKELKNEFCYWFPTDLRVSGKDLVPNHLTMCLYNHFAIWDDPKMLPKSYSINGYMLLNGEKMSKHTGNFMTLNEAITRYGTDATRIALAEAGTGMDDGNFTEGNAQAAILKLFTEREWCQKMIIELIKSERKEVAANFWEKVFLAQIMECLTKCEYFFETKNFFKALIHGFYNLFSARDEYRRKYESKVIECNYEIILKYLEIHVLLIYPICPHYSDCLIKFAEKYGIKILKKWPLADKGLNKYLLYHDSLENIAANIRKSIKLLQKKFKAEKIKFSIYQKVGDCEMEILDIVKKNASLPMDWKLINNTISELKVINKNEYYKYGNYVKLQIEKYGFQWINWMLEDDPNQYEIISNHIGRMANEIKLEFEFELKYKSEIPFKNGPWDPKIMVLTHE